MIVLITNIAKNNIMEVTKPITKGIIIDVVISNLLVIGTGCFLCFIRTQPPGKTIIFIIMNYFEHPGLISFRGLISLLTKAC
jgi:hypothetical protein